MLLQVFTYKYEDAPSKPALSSFLTLQESKYWTRSTLFRIRAYSRTVENTTKECVCAWRYKSKFTLCKLCTLRQEKYWHCFRFLAAAHWCLIHQLLLPSTEDLMPGCPVGLRTRRRFLGTHILWLPAESLDNDLPQKDGLGLTAIPK